MYCKNCGSLMPINNNICPNCGEMHAIPAKKQISTAVCIAGAILASFALLTRVLYYFLYYNSGMAVTDTLYALLSFFDVKISLYIILDILLFAAIVVGFVLLRKQPIVLAIACSAYALIQVGVEVYTVVLVVGGYSLISISYIFTRLLSFLAYIGIGLLAAALFTRNEARKILAIVAASCIGVAIIRTGLGFRYLLLGNVFAFISVGNLASVLIHTSLLIAAVGIAVSTKKTEKNRQY